MLTRYFNNKLKSSTMVKTTNNTFTEIQHIAYKIENNTAQLTDYQNYETLLTEVGLPRDFIFSYLKKADIDSWEALVEARAKEEKMQRENLKAMAVGGVVGIGIGVVLAQSHQ